MVKRALYSKIDGVRNHVDTYGCYYLTKCKRILSFEPKASGYDKQSLSVVRNINFIVPSGKKQNSFLSCAGHKKESADE